jgi:hypothetical protein
MNFAHKAGSHNGGINLLHFVSFLNLCLQKVYKEPACLFEEAELRDRLSKGIPGDLTHSPFPSPFPKASVSKSSGDQTRLWCRRRSGTAVFHDFCNAGLGFFHSVLLEGSFRFG